MNIQEIMAEIRFELGIVAFRYPLVGSRWSWGGLAFLIAGGIAAFTMPRPLGFLLAILGLVVCAATMAGEIMLARHTKSEVHRQRPSTEENVEQFRQFLTQEREQERRRQRQAE